MICNKERVGGNILTDTPFPTGEYYNGKPIYRCVMETAGASANTRKIITNYNFANKKILSVSGVLTQTDNSKISAGIYYDDTSYAAVWVNADGNVCFKSKTQVTAGILTVIYCDS